jgi:aspartyl protease family protein
MKKGTILLLLASILFFCFSCGGRKAKPDPLFIDYNYDDETYSYGGMVEIPFKQHGGVRIVQVKINDCAEFPMIFDTGCSGVAMSILELGTLVKHGYISEEDVIGMTRAQIADGSIVENAVVNLKKLQIGDYVCYNVEASVSDNEQAPLLLGNGALKDVESFNIDDKRKVISLYLK